MGKASQVLEVVGHLERRRRVGLVFAALGSIFHARPSGARVLLERWELVKIMLPRPPGRGPWRVMGSPEEA